MAFARRKKEAAGCSSIVFHPVEKVHCNIFRVNSHHPKKKDATGASQPTVVVQLHTSS